MISRIKYRDRLKKRISKLRSMSRKLSLVALNAWPSFLISFQSQNLKFLTFEFLKLRFILWSFKGITHHMNLYPSGALCFFKFDIFGLFSEKLWVNLYKPYLQVHVIVLPKNCGFKFVGEVLCSLAIIAWLVFFTTMMNYLSVRYETL